MFRFPCSISRPPSTLTDVAGALRHSLASVQRQCRSTSSRVAQRLGGAPCGTALLDVRSSRTKRAERLEGIPFSPPFIRAKLPLRGVAQGQSSGLHGIITDSSNLYPYTTTYLPSSTTDTKISGTSPPTRSPQILRRDGDPPEHGIIGHGLTVASSREPARRHYLSRLQHSLFLQVFQQVSWVSFAHCLTFNYRRNPLCLSARERLPPKLFNDTPDTSVGLPATR